MVWKQRRPQNCRMGRTPKNVRQLHRWLTSAKRRRKQLSRGSCSTLQMADSQVGRHSSTLFFFTPCSVVWPSPPTLFFRASLSVAKRRESSHCHEENFWDLASSPWLLAAGWHHTVSLNGGENFECQCFHLLLYCGKRPLWITKGPTHCKTAPWPVLLHIDDLDSGVSQTRLRSMAGCAEWCEVCHPQWALQRRDEQRKLPGD